MSEPVVRISGGDILGRSGTDINGSNFYIFQGIPYAKPPIGELRFKSPVPPEPWHDVRDCREEGNASIGRHSILGAVVGDEDCLVLNVFTPSLANKKAKAVMFYIHGGGFTSGSSSTEVYGPEYLLSEDVVLVTVNYRLGIFGFLSMYDPDLKIPGNAGMKDLVMALKWVQTNIARFGGDPNNVTIFGESAGGAAVHYLMLSPVTRGLFHKCILQSGTALHLWAIGTRFAQQMADILQLNTTNERIILAKLMEMSGEELYINSEKMPDKFIMNQQRPAGPIVEYKSEDAFIWEHPLDIIRSGNYNQVPMLLGYTTREGMLSEILDRPKSFSIITDFRLSVPFAFNLNRNESLIRTVAQQIKQYYYGDREPTIDDKDTFFLMQSDNFFIREVLNTIDHHLPTIKHPIYLYRMSIETSLNMLKVIYEIKDPGVCHADDIGYLFKNLLSGDLIPGSDEDKGVRRFVKFWTNFAKNGNPNPTQKDDLINVHWQPVTPTKKHFIDIGKELTTGVNPEKERMDFWKDIQMFANSRSKL